MKAQRYLFLLSIICLSFLLLKCGKDGAVGPQGDTGDKGANGINGNANVKVDTFTVKSSDWLYPGSYAVSIGPGTILVYTSKYFTRNNTLITQDVLNTGMVLVYFQSVPNNNTAIWQTLPFTLAYAPDYSFNWASETSIGKVKLQFYFSKIINNPPALSTYTLPTAKFKIVVVTGTIISSIRQNHININNYNEVSKFLNIP